MRTTSMRTVLLIVFLAMIAHAQTNHERLLYQHPLTSDSGLQGMILNNTDGVFTAEGWQSVSATSQLMITLPEGLPFEGTFKVRLSNFDPYNQNINQKQPIIDLYSQPCGNKEIYDTDGAWFHLISGTGYESGVPGQAGFKLWAAPRGVGSKDEDRVMNDATWDPSRTYEFAFVWSGTTLTFLVDGIERLTLPFAGQVEPFKYIFLGKDNLIYGYTAQPGPIFSNMRLYGPGDPIIDDEPPVLERVVALARERVWVVFDQEIESASAGNPANYSIAPSVTIQGAEIQPDGSSVVLATSPHQESVSYTLSVENIDDTETPPNTLTSASLTYRFVDQPITAISRSNYELASRVVGDPVYSDRDYVYTAIPSRLSQWSFLVTANDDKALTLEDFLTFFAAQPLDLVIGYDIRVATLPSWLQGWQSTGETLTTDDTVFNLYEKSIEQGWVTLGGNGQATSASMYVILLKPQSSTIVDLTPPAPPSGVRVRYP
ncbi:hypothetical protein JW992_06590 [candidate division KSB1 bacterium]|nr:hypothetical protein [candidate division KSB1 bacterium]